MCTTAQLIFINLGTMGTYGLQLIQFTIEKIKLLRSTIEIQFIKCTEFL